MSPKSERIELVDALRGFALLAIILLHNLTHFNLSFAPVDTPLWLKTLDSTIWDTLFFTMEGKAFAIFALMFGFSFFVQFDNAKKRGTDLKGRFAWRMIILILFAQFNALFYNGDILFLYALMGIVLIPFANLSNKTLLYIALFLTLQPFEWGRVIYASLNPDYVMGGDWNWPYYTPIIETMKNGSYFEMLYSNITEGQIWNNLWQIEDGRLFKISSLFIFGMLLGRLRYFVKSAQSIKFWKQVLLWGIIAFAPLYCIKTCVGAGDLITNNSILIPFNIAVISLMNFAFMCIIVSSFSLLWFQKNGYKFQRFIIPYGRMSLTNYITQSIIGCFIYLNYGLGLYQHTGATLSLLIGVGIFMAQLLFSRWWLSQYKQGPLEYLWKKMTWINSKSKTK